MTVGKFIKDLATIGCGIAAGLAAEEALASDIDAQVSQNLNNNQQNVRLTTNVSAPLGTNYFTFADISGKDLDFEDLYWEGTLSKDLYKGVEPAAEHRIMNGSKDVLALGLKFAKEIKGRKYLPDFMSVEAYPYNTEDNKKQLAVYAKKTFGGEKYTADFLWKANFPKAEDYGEATFSRKLWKTANIFGQVIYDGKNKYKIRGRGGFGCSF